MTKSTARLARPVRLPLVSAALLATTALCLPSAALAQSVPAPKFTSPDAHGVDLTTGLPWVAIEEGGIGSGPGRLSMQRIYAEGAGFVDNWNGGLYKRTSGGITKYYVQFSGISDTFSGSGTTWTSDKGDGATLTADQYGLWYYTARDGTEIQFQNTSWDNTSFNCPGADSLSCQVPLSITQPNGLKFTFHWQTATICDPPLPGEPGCQNPRDYERLRWVKSSAGYELFIGYSTDSIGSTDPNPDWFKRLSVSFGNSANEPVPAPTILYSYGTNTVDITDPAGRTWRFTTDTSGRLTGIRRPGSTENNVSYAYGTAGTITSATKDGVTNNYGLSGSTMTVTNALSQQTVVTSDPNIGRPTSYKDPLNRTTGYQYDSNGRLTRITQPEGNYTQYGYDARGNVTTTTSVAKSGSGLANIVTSSSFDSSCTNVVKCNKPNSTTDAKGNVTNYTYDATHGGILTITQPAPTTGAPRPQTRFTYSQVTGATGDLVYMPTVASACQTLTSCAGAADETKTTAVYNSNLLPTSITRANGTGTLSATSAVSYDVRGNTLTVDGPLSGTADTWAYKYDLADQMVGAILPDPDGTGSLKNRAVRITYRPDGQVSKQEAGTTAGQTDTDWASFAPLQTVDITFDGNSRPVTSRLSASGSDYSLTQTSYDALGRTDCTAARMNTAIYGALPTSACTLGTQGSFGPDRISQTVYDAAGQVTQAKVGVGTANTATERTLTYSNNGKLATLKDANNNVTSYTYDGFGRLRKTTYPDASHEDLAYDANNNVTSRTNRAAQAITYSYDALNRPTHKGGAAAGTDYGFDNLGRFISATFTTGGHGITNAYDALSRLTSTTSTMGGATRTLSYAYDLAGRRTQLSWPDAYYVNYDYLVTGELSKIRENGATSGLGVLATYAYDDLGNRTSLILGNGGVTTFGRDSASRLSSLANNLAGTSGDLTKTFSYNPANQIISETRNNDTYAWDGGADVNRGYTRNALNQYTAAGPASFTYDTKGNLTSDGTSSYGYDAENRLTSATVGGSPATLSYDTSGRLWNVVKGTTDLRFLYDGGQMIAHYNSAGALQYRYVFGPGLDEPLLQYDPSGVRTWYSADERGSIIADSDDTGALTGTLSYDEYGIPGSSNSGRFQYTGQMWLSELGMYFYKNRAYSPTLGRFLQTDPIGYGGDGPNLYAYVLNDPVNLVDPLGLATGSGCGGPSVAGPQGSIIVTGCRLEATPSLVTPSVTAGGNPNGSMQGERGGDHSDILVTGVRPQNENEIVVTAAATMGHNGGPPLDEIVVTGARSGGLKWLGLIGAIIGDIFFPDPACCFTAGTLVDTPSGLKPIETLRTGDLVISRDPSTGATVNKQITAITPAHERRIWTVTVSYKGERGKWRDEHYETTDDHPWRTVNGTWLTSAALKPGQSLARENGTAIVVSVADTGKTELTYNLTIADFHTYFVGQAKTWVHNACGPSVGDAQRAFRTNPNFRRYFHRWKQSSGLAGDGAGTRNSDLSGRDMLEAFEDWIADGMPSG